MKFRAVCAAFAAAALLAGCPGEGNIGGALVVATVEVSPDLVDIVLGQTSQLAAAPKTSSGIAVTGRVVTWSTTDQSIARVSTSGLVTAMGVGGPVRIRATVDGVIGDALVTVRVVPVDHVTIDPPESGILVNSQLQLNAKALDPTGAELSGRSFLWQSSASSIAAVTSTGLVLGVSEGGPVIITATSEGKTGTATVSVSTRPATRLAFQQQPGLAIAGEAMTPAVRIALQDDFLATVLGATNPVTIALAGNPGNATLTGTTTRNAVNGIATFNDLVLNRVGTAYTFLVTSPNLAAATSIPFNVIAGSANQLAFTTAPSSTAQSGALLAQQPVVRLKDGSGNDVAQANVVVTASIASGPAGATLGGTLTATTNSFGVASFSGLVLSGPAGSYTLSFAAPGVTPLISGPIVLSAGGATALFLATQPSSTAASGVPFGQQPGIQLRDAVGNNVAQPGVVVTAAIASGGGAVTGTTTATTNASGLATFSSLAISGPSGSYTLQFSAPSVAPVTSGAIVLGAGAAGNLFITVQPPSTAMNGGVLAPQPAVRLRDASNNPVAQAGVQVIATVSGSATLGGTTTATTDANGVATFSNLAITGQVGSYTLTFSASGLAPAESSPITLTAGAATQLGITTQPSPGGASGVALGTQPVIQIQDASGNPVSQAGTSVVATIASGPAGATLGGTASVNTNAQGVATFTNLAITGPSGTYTLRFAAAGLGNVTSTGITLGAGAPTKLSITTQPATSAQAGVVFGPQPVIQLRDAADNTVAQAGVIVTASIASGGGALGGTVTATTNASGVATFGNLSISGTIGARTLTFTASGLTPITSGTVTLSAGPASKLSITTQPSSSAQSGVAFGQQPVIQLRDAADNAVSQAGVNVTVALASGAAALSGTLTVATNASGVATFAGLVITGVAGDRTLTFTSGSLTAATSGTITVTAGAASKLAITTQPSSATPNDLAFAQQPVIQLLDASDNPVTTNGVMVTAAISSGGGVLGGTLTVATVSGVATFTNLKITGTIGNRQILFTAPTFASVTSGTVNVTAGSATKLFIATQPSAGPQSGVPFPVQPVIQLRDVSDNNVSQATVTVTAAITAGGTGILSGTLTATTNASGTATFSNLTISGIAGAPSRTLTFTSGSLTATVSNGITLTPGPASKLSITTQPAPNPQSGVPFSPQAAIQLRDAADNAVSQAAVVISATITAGGTGTLSGTMTATTNASGLATFTDLTISGTAGAPSRTLTFASGALTSVTSGAITLTAGSASKLSITTQPSSSAQSGVAFGQQPVIQLRDAADNAVSQAGVNVTVALASGAAALSGTLTVATNASGVATFAGLVITGVAGDRTLTFTSGSLTAATSGTITVTAGAASKLAITTQPSSATPNDLAFAQQPVIQLLDASDNPVTTNGVMVTAAISSGGGVLGGTLTVATVSGVATFTNLKITGTIGNRQILFTAPTFASVTSGTVNVTAGSATKLFIATQPSAGPQSGVPFPIQPVIRLRDVSDNDVSQAGVNVTAALATGSPALTGTLTVPTNSSGVAAFTDLKITGTIGIRALSFASGSLTGTTSGNVNVVAGAADHLSITTQPSSTAQSGAAFLQQPVIQLRDASNNAVSQQSVAITASIASGPGSPSLGGTAVVVTDANGAASFGNLSLNGLAGNYTIGFSGSGLTDITSGTVTLSAGSATKLSLTTQPSPSVQNAVDFPVQPSIQLRDGADNPVAQAGVVITVNIQTGAGTLSGTTSATTLGTGVATFTNLRITGTVGDRTLLFAAASLVSVASNTVTVTPGAATKLTITTPPTSPTQSGAAFAQQPVIQLRDASDNAVSQGSVVVTAALASGGGALGGTTTATTNGSGVATFTNLSITGTVGNRTLTFTSGVLTAATTGPISITAGGATKLTITTPPTSPTQSGAAFAQQPVIQLRDASDNAVSQGSVVVTAALASGGGALGGTTTATTNGSGVATFTDLSITGTVGNRTLTFTSGVLTAATTGPISITAGGATKLTITTPPTSPTQSGAAFAQQPVIQLRDASDNAVSQGSVVVTAALASGGGALGGTTTATTNGSGVATFTDLSITGTVGNRTLTFTSGVLTAATTGPISITAGGATKLTITTPPTSPTQSGAAFAQQPVIQLRDASDNAVSQGSVVVTAALASGGGALGGTTTATTNGSGVATFTDLSITGTVGNRTLTFTSGVLTAATTGPISITAGGATKLTITTPPTSPTQSGAAFAQQPVIQLRDASDNAVSQGSVVVTAALASGGGALGGTTTATTNGSGVATFTDLSITGTVGNRTLTFTSGVLTAATTGPISITAGGATKLTITTPPTSPTQSGAAFAQQPVIQLRDASDNAVSQGSVVVTAALASGGGALGGTTTATTNGSGVATFTDLSITGTVGNRTLTFTSGVLTAATTGPISITAGAATHLVITQQPVGAASGTTLAPQPIVAIRDASNNTVITDNTTQVTVTIISGADGTLGGTQTVTAANGIATFTNVTLAGTVGTDYMLEFTSSPVFTPATSNPVTVTFGAMHHLTITTEPPANTTSSTVFLPAPVIQLRDSAGNPVPSSGQEITVTVIVDSGSGTLAGTLSATSDVDGKATFTDLRIDGTGGTFRLVFASIGLTSVTSITIIVSP